MGLTLFLNRNKKDPRDDNKPRGFLSNLISTLLGKILFWLFIVLIIYFFFDEIIYLAGTIIYKVLSKI